MKTLRAVHSIVMTIEPGKAGDKAKGILPVRPKTVTILPKTRFKAQNDEQEAELLKLGAAVVADAPEADPVVDPAVVAAPKKSAAEKKADKAAAKAPAPAAKADEADEGGEGDDDDDDDDGDDGTGGLV